MTTFTMKQLEAMAGQGDGADTYQNHSDTDTSRSIVWMQPTIYSRIVDVVSRGGAMTRRQIADALQLKKTPWLVTAIERLVSEGHLIKFNSVTKQGVIMCVYEVAK